ncbi:MAG: creatininase family protein [Deltaproteobacteria bacterium]|nr:creatininase family protein [Deltaproteobacteria bacterium]
MTTRGSSPRPGDGGAPSPTTNPEVPESGKDPLRPLTVIRRLEVGPVELQPTRLVCPYRVVQKEGSHVFELSYVFEEEVFTPGEPASENLAAMMAAQVALNYGLFCKEIVFAGPFDAVDRQFLEEMARNTAREIYVKKFLEPNPFIVGPAASLPVVKRESYLRAALYFKDPPPVTAVQGSEEGARRWGVESSRHAVLSSGGKDSLLSFGALRELGKETHAIFVNEAGRHWFTALNAYRHFAANVPGTARVWTNADRLFSWMKRHLAFVRPDFARVRADEYPVRLWTVAVFLFGALPLLRKRGIGRLIIGDEYDTTVRTTHRGITHYNGLFDQSRYFDAAMSRYFHRKGFGVSQFSILRPLSEILIEKILAERYPDLIKFQVSCHATHTEGERVLPCGACEKCRRIVGMLVAMGTDPAVCGYTPKQVEQCLRALAEGGVHQEAEGAQHLAYLLARKGLLPEAAVGRAKARPRPEVMKLRFDPERSPLGVIPADLRGALFRIYLQHAEGAVQRSGRLWLDFEPLSDPAIATPHTSGEEPPAPPPATEPAPGGGRYLLAEMTWPEAQARLKESDVALLPVGAIEQHGPHLPLDTDAFDADYLARRVAEGCSDPKPLVLPVMAYGVSYHHADFAGTLSVSPETLSRMVYEVGTAVARHGVTKLVIVNGHGGNGPALHFAAQMINRDARIFTCVESGETSDPDIYALVETPNDVHAGEIETSTTLAVRPELVHMDEAREFVPRFTSRYLDFASKRSVGWYAHTAQLSPSGVFGDPTKATREKGDRIWELMIKHLVHFIEDIKFLTLDEIYERRV